jgi:protein associated with RNAse G/E
VDDLFLTGDENLIIECKRNIAPEFEMKDLGMMHYFLGLEVWQKSNEIFLSQGKYVVEILKRFKMMDCKSMPTLMVMNLKLLSDTSSKTVDVTMYRKMIGSLLYLTKTRPYICFVVNSLRQYITKTFHLIVEKHVLRYLKGTIDFGLRYVLDCKIRLQGYDDSYWASSVTYQKSTSGCCFSLGSAMIAWLNRKQISVALNTAKAEYIEACSVSIKVVCLQKFLA